MLSASNVSCALYLEAFLACPKGSFSDSVMVAGGGGLDPDTELWDPETGEWSDGGPLTTLGYKLSMAPIRNGTGERIHWAQATRSRY